MEILLAIFFVVGMWNLRVYMREAVDRLKQPDPMQFINMPNRHEEHERQELLRLRHTPGSKF